MSNGDPPDATLKVRAPTARSFAGGRYAVQRVLGEGGQKVVYLVRDTALDRESALAWIKLHGLDADDVERLRQEAMLMARLGAHPNIVTVYDIGGEEGRPYVISEYIAGGDLAGLLRAAGGPLPIDRALAIGADLAQALAAAHERGIIHRDLKPANVWLTETGAAKLGDFGLALASDRSRLTEAGTMVGTAAYMAPEQALGGDVDARSDLYALGAVLYEMLTGRPPFLGDNVVAVVSQHINTAPVAPSWHNAEVPRALEELVLRLLAKAPQDRPGSAEAVREALMTTKLSAPVPVVAERGVANPLDRLASGVFVGREQELGKLRAALDDALSGRGRLVMLMGEPGIGKTRTASELATYAQLRGAQVLWGRCYEGEGAPAYWPWVQLIRSYVHDREANELRSEMGAGAADIAQVVSEVRERLPDLPSLPPLEPEQARFRLFDSIATFLRNAADGRPLVLVLDDLHWADKPSLLLLQFLAREMQTARLLVVGTYRDVEVRRRHPLSETLGELAREQLSSRVLLRGLTEAELAHLVEMTAGVQAPESLVAAVHRETEGNPFFLTEVVRLLVGDGRLDGSDQVSSWTITIPQGVREVVGQRLERLSERCNRVLTTASVIGREFALGVLEGASDLSGEELLEALEEALAARVILEIPRTPDRYGFSHALVRETLYDELTTARRLRLHRRIAEVLETVYGAQPEPHLAELAHHFCEGAHAGGDIDKAVQYAWRAGERAQALFAWEEAARLYQIALQALELKTHVDDMERCELLLALGDVQMKAGDEADGRETLQLAADLAKSRAAGEQLARAALTFAGLWIGGTAQEVRTKVAFFESALGVLGKEDSALRSRVLCRLAAEYLESPDSERFTSLSQEGLAMARRVGDPAAISWGLVNTYYGLMPSPDVEGRLAVAEERIEIGEGAGDKDMAIMAMGHRIAELLVLGELPAADAAIEVQAMLAEELRQPDHLRSAEWPKATRALMAGHFDEGEQLARRALDLGKKVSASWALEYFWIQMLASLRDQGRLSELEPLAREYKEGRSLDEQALWCSIVAFICGEGTRVEEARAILEQIVERNFMGVSRCSWLLAASLSCETCAAVGDARRAAKLYELVLPYSRNNVVGTAGEAICFWGPVTRYLGLLATTTARWDEAAQHFEDALSRNTKLGARPWLARTQYDYARMLLTRGDPADRPQGLQLLNQSLEAAREMGMTALVQQAETVLKNARGGRE